MTIKVVAWIALSIFGSGLLQKICLSFHPTSKVGVESVPPSGGLGIFLSIVFNIFFGISIKLIPSLASNDLLFHWSRFWLGAVMLLALGICDDRVGLSVATRLFIQVIVASLLIGAPFSLSTGIWSTGFLIFFVVAMVNAVNLIDGIDGLAGGFSLICFLVFSWHFSSPLGNSAAKCMAESALIASLAFLSLNRPPAKIYLGNGGAYLLGFVLAAVSIAGVREESIPRSLELAAFVFAYPFVNLIWVVARRLVEKRSPFAADRYHFHYMLVDKGVSPLGALSLLLFACTAWQLGLFLLPL